MNVKSYDKKQTNIKPHINYTYSNNDIHHVTKTFTPHNYTSRNFTSSHLNFTQLHFTKLYYALIWLNPTQNIYRSISPHHTSLNYTSRHFTAILEDFGNTSFPLPSQRTLDFTGYVAVPQISPLHIYYYYYY
jgi:hypothetical protein